MSVESRRYSKMKQKYEFRDQRPTCIKCVLVGDAGVGKTSLAARISSRKFKPDYVPTVFDNYAATVMLDDKPVHFSLFDTAGKEDYDRLRVISYMNCDVFLVCFSVYERETLESVEGHWIPEIRQYLPKVPYILVATQIDRRSPSPNMVNDKPSVTFKEASELATRCGAASYIECSAMTSEGVCDVIRDTIETVQKSLDCRSNRSACCGCTLV
ncbi:CDC42-like protein [Mya arenaria]|uniref:CDC42-like protein n=1 Tax=Mya arenaria TaxID=6604 RepID=A0ABY7F8U7_MYAAR|nr:cell division control protein 42 homolog [Mya arenaria]WAR18622.1 CDC42-like protein [Mya arenaria]